MILDHFFAQGCISEDIDNIVGKSIVQTVKSITQLQHLSKNQRQINQAGTIINVLVININEPEYLTCDIQSALKSNVCN